MQHFVSLGTFRGVLRPPNFMYDSSLTKDLYFPGESILMCRPSEKQKVQELVNSDLRPVQSCLVQDNAGSGEETLCSSMKR